MYAESPPSVAKFINMDDETLLSDIVQVETLIHSLYEPNSPDTISRTQSVLSRLQCSPQAWSLAHNLLERPNEKTKFFGALTIIVKLNLESSSLSDTDATELLASLIRWHSKALYQGQLVLRKLSSALATYFLHFHRLWGSYIRHLELCLASNHSWHPDVADNPFDHNAVLANLDSSQMQSILWVISNVLEDAVRLDLNSATHAGLYDCVIRSTQDAMSLVESCLTRDQISITVKEDAIRCLQSWILFAQRTSSHNSVVLDIMGPLLRNVIDSLLTDELYGASVEMLIEALSTYPPFLDRQHCDFLEEIFKTSWFRDKYGKLVSGDFDFDALQLGQLLLAFSETRITVLVGERHREDQELLSYLCGLLAADGFAVAEDKIFVPAVEFWSTFAEALADEVEAPVDPSGNPAILLVMQAVANACRKTILPSSDELHSWDSNDRIGLHEARKDVVDFLQSVYVLVGPRLVETFSTLTLSALSASSWLELEAASFYLGGLADCNREDVRCDEALNAVFSSPLFQVLQESQSDVPIRTRQTCLALIEQYTEYFERYPTLLPSALNLLFSEMAVNALAMPAAKSIYRLCSSCRSHLFPEIDRFVGQFSSLVSGQQLDCISRERISGALASIAQAIPYDDQRHEACAKILGFIKNDVQWSRGLNHLTDSGGFLEEIRGPCLDFSLDEHPGLHIALRALRCLVAVGKGLQVPSEALIDLDSESLVEAEPNGAMIQLQNQIMGIIIEVQSHFSKSTEVTEMICSILRTGFSETSPGPFVFPASDVANFLVRHTTDTPRIGLLVSTACSFMSSFASRPTQYGPEILSSVLSWVIGLVKQLPGPEAEMELAQNSIEFVSRLLNKRPETFTELQPPEAAEFFFVFTLQTLDGREPLLKAAAAEFWSTFAGLLRAEQSAFQESMKQAMSMLGPLLSRSLARNYGGNASRSELDRLSEPLKKLVRYPKAKEWLQAGLNDPSFPSSRVTAEQKRLFVQKIISLRGSRTTNQVVREFWLDARGSNFAYTS